MDTLFNIQEEKMRDIMTENEKFIKDYVDKSIKYLKEEQKKRKKLKRCKKYSKNVIEKNIYNNIENEKIDNKK